MSGKRCGAAASAVAAWLLAWASPALGGAPDPGEPTPLTILIEPRLPLPDQGTGDGYLVNLRPLAPAFGRTLADRGVYVEARELAEPMGAVGGGLKRGGFYEGYAEAGADLDLDRIAGIPGAAFHLIADDLQGQAYWGYTGSTYSNNRIYALSAAFRLSQFDWEQTLDRGAVDLRGGRIAAFTQFDGSELYCTFITDLCRTASVFTFDRGSPGYVASSWAAIAEARITPRTYAHAAIYEDQPILAESNHGGWPGPDWGLNYATGATIPVQFGYRTTVANDRMPRSFSAGGFYDTGSYSDPLLDVAGRNRIVSGGKAAAVIGKSVVWLQAQQMVFRPDASERGLTLFGGADWATSGQPALRRMVFGGGYWRGVWRSRPNDSLGFAVTWTGINPRIAERVTSLLALTGGGQGSADEVSVQGDAGIAVAPGILVKPFVAFVSHPDRASDEQPVGSLTHSWLVGTLLEFDAVSALGLPTMGAAPLVR